MWPSLTPILYVHYLNSFAIADWQSNHFEMPSRNHPPLKCFIFLVQLTLDGEDGFFVSWPFNLKFSFCVYIYRVLHFKGIKVYQFYMRIQTLINHWKLKSNLWQGTCYGFSNEDTGYSMAFLLDEKVDYLMSIGPHGRRICAWMTEDRHDWLRKLAA